MKKLTISFFLFGLFMTALLAQPASTPKDMLEVGAQGGYLFVAGDVTPAVGSGYGVHIRKATDHLFSLRLDIMGGKAKGDNMDNSFRKFEMDWLATSAIGQFSLNNVRFDRSSKKLNYSALVGVGGSFFETTFESSGIGNPRKGTIDREFAAHMVFGAGIAFRLSKNLNVAIEHQAFNLFGSRRDLLDGIENENDGNQSVFGDLLNFTSIQLNMNLGNPSNRSEPLYWVNPGKEVMQSIDNIKKRQDAALADTDQDGIIDAIDQEPNTPVDVPVDTKGRTLDSDKDGVPDYKDVEPYYPPRAGERVNEDGVVINPISAPGGGVTEDRVKEMIDEALSDYGLTEPKSNVAEWFLPMLHFGISSYTVKYSDYGTLASVARMLKSNSSMRLVITGYTDQTGQESFNEALSYQRALSVAEHLVNQHGIGRGRLVIHWKGQDEALVPSSASYMNRRVEFRVASSSDTEMDPPSGTPKNKNGGY